MERKQLKEHENGKLILAYYEKHVESILRD